MRSAIGWLLLLAGAAALYMKWAADWPVDPDELDQAARTSAREEVASHGR